ncbi:MAG: AAA family ATPase [Geminicoccaceae bacterium]
MGQLIAVANTKGGVGKSTLSVHFTRAVMARGYDVALIDTDPQQSAADWFEQAKKRPHVERLPLINLEGTGNWIMKSRPLIARMDLVIVDFPSVVTAAIGAACLTADVLVIPTQLSEMDLRSTARTLAIASRARKTRPNGLPRIVIVPNRVRPADERLELLSHLVPPKDTKIADPLPEDDRFSNGHAKGRDRRDETMTAEWMEPFHALVETVERELRSSAEAKTGESGAAEWPIMRPSRRPWWRRILRSA